jgi:hypothetical protein
VETKCNYRTCEILEIDSSCTVWANDVCMYEGRSDLNRIFYCFVNSGVNWCRCPDMCRDLGRETRAPREDCHECNEWSDLLTWCDQNYGPDLNPTYIRIQKTCLQMAVKLRFAVFPISFHRNVFRKIPSSLPTCRRCAGVVRLSLAGECERWWRKVIAMNHSAICLLSWSLTFRTDFTRRTCCPETVQSARRCAASARRRSLFKNRTIIISVASRGWLGRNSSFVQFLVELGPCSSGRISGFRRSLISERSGLSLLKGYFPLWGRVSRMF